MVERQDGYHSDRLAQTWATGAKDVERGSGLRARVWNITYITYLVWCAGKITERRQALNEY